MPRVGLSALSRTVLLDLLPPQNRNDSRYGVKREGKTLAAGQVVLQRLQLLRPREIARGGKGAARPHRRRGPGEIAASELVAAGPLSELSYK